MSDSDVQGITLTFFGVISFPFFGLWLLKRNGKKINNLFIYIPLFSIILLGIIVGLSGDGDFIDIIVNFFSVAGVACFWLLVIFFYEKQYPIT